MTWLLPLPSWRGGALAAAALVLVLDRRRWSLCLIGSTLRRLQPVAESDDQNTLVLRASERE
jgi:hypothetical protein